MNDINFFAVCGMIVFMMAWHTFSAIPDIASDTSENIKTTAVIL
jgi:4-hydroxybenzoate polyprenyltransferase